MLSDVEYDHMQSFLSHLIKRDRFGAAIAYYRCSPDRREKLWNPLRDADMPRWVEQQKVIAYATAYENGNQIAMHRIYKASSITTRAVLDRFAKAFR